MSDIPRAARAEADVADVRTEYTAQVTMPDGRVWPVLENPTPHREQAQWWAECEQRTKPDATVVVVQRTVTYTEWQVVT